MLNRVLVTGGNKGIGLEVVKKFLEVDFEVIAVGRDFSNFPKELKENEKVKTIEYDLSNIAGLKDLAKDVERLTY